MLEWRGWGSQEGPAGTEGSSKGVWVEATACSKALGLRGLLGVGCDRTQHLELEARA